VYNPKVSRGKDQGKISSTNTNIMIEVEAIVAIKINIKRNTGIEEMILLYLILMN